MAALNYSQLALRIAAAAAIRIARQMQVLMEEWYEDPPQEWYVDAEELQRRLALGDREGVARAIPLIMLQIAQQQQEGAAGGD